MLRETSSAIIGGVITSTLLTLVVVPVIYSYLVRDRRSAAAPASVPAARLVQDPTDLADCPPPGAPGSLPPLAAADRD